MDNEVRFGRQLSVSPFLVAIAPTSQQWRMIRESMITKGNKQKGQSRMNDPALERTYMHGWLHGRIIYQEQCIV